MKKVIRYFSNTFWEGIIFFVPLIFVVLIAAWTFNFADEIGNYFLKLFFKKSALGLGFLFFLAVIFFTGFLMKLKFLRQMIDFLPLIGGIIKWLNHVQELKKLMTRPVLIKNEMGGHIVGFVTGAKKISGSETMIKIVVFTAHFAARVELYEPEKEILIGLTPGEAWDWILFYGIFSQSQLKNDGKLKKAKLSEILEKK